MSPTGRGSTPFVDAVPPEGAEAPVPASPVTFGDPRRPLAGWLHAPARGAARGGVLLCPPVGKEYQSSYYTLRLLAEGLAARGFVVLRFDYDGTGDSDGSTTDPGRVAAWTDSVRAGLALLRAMNLAHVSAVGLRLGALLATIAGDHLHGLVLWDPVSTGAGFLREQRALAAMTIGADARVDGSVEAPWVLFDKETVADLRALSTPDPVEIAGHVLVLERDDRRLSPRARGQLTAPTIQWDTVAGHEQLMAFSAVPTAAVAQVIAWLDEQSTSGERAFRRPVPAGSRVVHDGEGHPVTETVIRAGAAGVIGILSAADASAGPVVVLVGGHVDHHVGPGRLWVDLARRWAGTGVRVLRVDLSGIGDSGVRPGQLPQRSYAVEAAEDLRDVVAAIGLTDPRDVVLAGFCAGAYAVIEAAVLLRPRAVITVNYVQEFTPPEVLNGGRADPRRSAWLARPRWVIALRDRGLLGRWRALMPEWGWRLLDRFGIIPSPATAFSVLVDLGVPTRAIVGRSDGEILLARASRQLLRLCRTGLFSFSVVDEVEHAVLSLAEREVIVEVLARELARSLTEGPPPTRGPQSHPRRAVVPAARRHIQRSVHRADTTITKARHPRP